MTTKHSTFISMGTIVCALIGTHSLSDVQCRDIAAQFHAPVVDQPPLPSVYGAATFKHDLYLGDDKEEPKQPTGAYFSLLAYYGG